MANPASGDVRLPTLAERAIRRRIARRGPITFAEFMDAALYEPGGYYTRATAGADYYTSPQAHPAFGALLAIQLFHIWTLLGRPRPCNVVELGAGDGLLCRDIITAAHHLPEGFGESVSYTLIDRCATAGWERSMPGAVRVAADALDGVGAPVPAAAHCVLSNELLDALPAHRVRMEKGRLRELYVAMLPDVADGYEGALIEFAGEPSTPLLQGRLSDLGVRLAEGQTAEICLLLDAWADATASMLGSGFALTIDYGREARDLYDPAQRPNGTLVTYRAHRQTDAPLHDVGRQDITAQVDFTSAQMAGERVGMTPVGNVSQGWLLRRLGLQTLRRNAAPSGSGGGWLTIPAGPGGALPHALPDLFGGAPDDGRDWLTNLSHLARPGGLGDFRVLLQAKGVPPRRAAAALCWPEGGAADGSLGYSPSALAELIPAEALRLEAERIRIAAGTVV